MKFSHLVTGAAVLLWSVAQAQQAQTPTTGSAGAATGDAWFPPESDFRKVILDEDAVVNGEATDTIIDPMELAVSHKGRVFWAERAGVVKMWNPETKKTVVIGTLPTFTGLEEGMLGITLDPAFDQNGWIYLNRSLSETYNDGRGKAGKIRIARFTLQGEQLDIASEKVIIEIEVQREQCCHVGGSLTFDKQGNLYISIGDNTNPFDSDGFSPSDERKGRYPWDAQGTAANPNSLVGKILRIKPKADGGYTIPEGNLFPPGTARTRPEIFVMGNRNPFRISIDPRTGYLYWGEVGPDAGGPSPKRGPAGFDEVNQARKAGFYGWPLFVGDNRPYRRIDFTERQKHQEEQAAYDKVRKQREEMGKKGETANLPELPAKPAGWEPTGDFWDAAHPMNRSPHNTGIQELPPAQPAFIYYPASASTRFPEVGSGGRTAMAGPVYYFDPANPSPTKLPKEFDRTLFIYEWSRDWIIAVKLDADHQIAKSTDGKPLMKRFMPSTKFRRPMDMELGADGCLYLIEFGKDWGNNKDTKIVRIEYAGKGNAGR